MKTSNLHSFDLRIGNLLLYEDRVIEVVGLNKGWIEYYNEEFDKCGDKPKYFHPIELTEELLVKIGFKKCDIVLYYRKEEENLVVVIIKDDDTFILKKMNTIDEVFIDKMTLTNVKYLHQLQNAYYCLTGKELNIEL